MPSGQYSYIDITALDAVRGHFAAGDALVLLTPALDEVIWANGQGAALFGYADIGSIIGREPEIGLAAKRQIVAAPGYPHIGRDRAVTIRLASGLTSRALSLLASEIVLPGGEDAILVAVPAATAAWLSPAETARRAIAGLGEAGQHAAIIDADGKTVAASGRFEGLGIGADVIGALVAEAAGERLIKRMIEAGAAFLPAGFVRLTDEPATHLLVVVDEAPEEEPARDEATDAAPAADTMPAGDGLAETAEAIAETGGDAERAVPGSAEQEATASGDASDEIPGKDAAEGEIQGKGAAELAEGPAQPDASADLELEQSSTIDPPSASGLDTSSPPHAHDDPEPEERSDPDAPVLAQDAGHRDSWYFAARDHDAEHPAAGDESAEALVPATAAGEDAEAAAEEMRASDTAAETELPTAAEALFPARADEMVPVPFGDASANGEEVAEQEPPTRSNETVTVPSDDTAANGEEAAVAPGEVHAAEEVSGAVAEVSSAVAEAPEPRPAIAVDRAAAPVRFVWKTDAEGRFSEISEDFVRTVGRQAADLVGVGFRDVSARLGIDPGGEIAGLLERRDTWSGRSVLWPVAGTDLRIPVDLAALPAYGRNREFAGFRGFGVARAGDAVVDPEAKGIELTEAPTDASGDAPGSEENAPAVLAGDQADTARQAASRSGPDPFQGEVPALSIVARQDRRQSDKVIRLAEHRPANGDKGLSPGERNAFREIGERLKKENDASEAPGELRADNDRGPAPPPVQEPALEPDLQRPADESSSGDNLQAAAATVSQLIAANEEAPPVEAVQPEEAGQPERSERADEAAETDTPAPGTTGAPATGQTAEAAGSAAAEDEMSAPIGEGIAPTSDTSAGEPAEIADPPEHLTVADETEPTSSPSWKGVGGAGSDARLETSMHDRSAIVGNDAPRFVPSAFATGAAAPRPPVETTILEQLPVPVLIHSGDALHYANREFLEFTGYDTVGELEVAGGLGALFGEPYARDEDDSGEGRKLRLRTSEGLEYPVEAFLQSVPWGEGKALLLSLRRSWRQPVSYPASPPVPADPALEERIAEMRAIVDTATDGVMLIARDGTIRSISRAAEALFGFDSEHVAGKPFASLFAIESQRAARDYLAGLSENGVASVLNDGREVIGREAQGRFIPLFMTIGKLPNDSGFCAVVRDITQWKRAEEELTQARAQAERASSQKTEFLARVSHEIRTPLNAIIGFSELMLDEKFGPILNDRYRDYLRDINRSGNHVLDLVNDLLDISKIEAGQQEMSYEAVSLNDTLTETVAMMQPQANRERVIIRSSFASRLPEVVADLRSIRQIALNLMSNAIRYTPAGGQVIVSTAYEASGDVVMRVRDTGIGMSQAEIEQALKPFKQINALKRTRGDGTGLGLPLTKAMVEANRARFMINSTPGEGTLVEITFPSTRVLAD